MSNFHLLPTRLQIRLGRLKRNLEALKASVRGPRRPPYRRFGRSHSESVDSRVGASSSGEPAHHDQRDSALRIERMVSQLAEAEKGDVFEVTFLPAGKTISIGEDQTLLSAGLAAGFALPFSCTAGGCAVCRIKLVSGKVEMDQPNCLTDEEIAEGFCLLCVGHPRSALVLDLGDEEC